MSSSTKASARLAPWFRTVERTQTAQKKRHLGACHPRCTLRHLRHTRGQLKHRTRTSTIKPRGMILFFTVIYNTHDHRNTDRPAFPLRPRFALADSRARDALHSDARRSIVERLERRTRIQTRARESSFGNRIAASRTRGRARTRRRPNARRPRAPGGRRRGACYGTYEAFAYKRIRGC